MKKLIHRLLVVFFLVFNSSSIWALDDAALKTIPPVKYYDPVSGEHKPFFPIGWYHFGPATGIHRLQDMADNGANMVHLADCGIVDWHWQYIKRNLDWAQQLGMKVVISLSRHLISEVDINNPESYTTFVSFIDSYKNHPALLGWQIGDEISTNPTTHSLYKATINTAQVIRDRDPNRQIWQLHGLTSNDNIIQYMVGTDVSVSDLYQCVAGESEFQEKRCFILLNYFLRRGILNGTNGWAGNVQVTQAAGLANDAALRFPTPGEYRWNVYSGLASAGNRGIKNWVYSPELYKSGTEFTDFMNYAVKPVFSELNKISHAMETGWNVGSVEIYWDKKNWDRNFWKHKFDRVSQLLLYDNIKNKYFLVITNNAGDPQKVTVSISNLPAPVRDLNVSAVGTVSKKRKLTDNGGILQLRDKIPGFGAMIYEFKARSEVAADETVNK